MEPAQGRGRADRAAGRVARTRHARLGVGWSDGERRQRLHSRLRRGGRPSARRRRSRVPSPSPSTQDENPIVEEDTEGDLSGHGTACAGIVRSIAPECDLYSVRVLGAGFTGSGPVLLAGLQLGGRAGLRPDQHEPVDDEAPVRGAAPRSRGLGVLPPHDARRGRAQHAGRELPVEVLLRDLRRAATRSRSDDVLLQPEPAGRVLRARRRGRRRLAGRLEDQGVRATASRRRT